MPGGLLTDLYELNMAASYLRRSMTGQATFSLFVRALPPGRGFLVAAGLADCLQFLEDFSFTPDDLGYLRQARGYGEDTLRAFAGLRFTGEVRAVPEGRVVFAGEPLLEVTAPLAEAQLAETVLANHVTFQTAVATKAARCVLAARGAQLVDFAFRRTQGIDASMAVARASAIAGFTATSNVAAARRYGLAATGTMAHSFIEAFGDEQAAFAAFAADFPAMTAFLVDTYDTGRGVHNAIEVTRRLRLPGPVGVRLDSGDLAALARMARAMLDEAGLADARIFASGGLDEYAIAGLAAARGADRRVRGGHQDGRLLRRAVSGQRLQAGRLRRAAGDEAVRGQDQPPGSQAGVPRPGRRRARAAGRAPATRPPAPPLPGHAPGPGQRPRAAGRRAAAVPRRPGLAAAGSTGTPGSGAGTGPDQRSAHGPPGPGNT